MSSSCLHKLILAASVAAFATGVQIGDNAAADVDFRHTSDAGAFTGANATSSGSAAAGRRAGAGKSFLQDDPATGRPFDCSRNLEFWESMWPSAKKQWCCFHENAGCKTEHFNCADGLMYFNTEWSDLKREWCCHNHNVGCAKCDDFFCPEGHEKLQIALQGAIKCVKWPCKNSECCQLWGNMDLERLPTTAPTPMPTRDPTPVPTVAPTADEDRFHCGSALLDSLLGWSPAKKEWCCANRNVGCKDMHSEHIVSNEPHGAMDGGVNPTTNGHAEGIHDPAGPHAHVEVEEAAVVEHVVG